MWIGLKSQGPGSQGTFWDSRGRKGSEKEPLVAAVDGEEAGPPRGAKTPGGDGQGGAVTDESSALVSGSSTFSGGFWAQASLSSF